MYFFCGNLDFAEVFKKAGLAVTVVDAGAAVGNRVMGQGDVYKMAATAPGIVIIKNLHQLRANAEDRLLGNYLGDNARTKAPVLGDVRFDYYRQLKTATTKFVHVMSELRNSRFIIFTAPLTEELGLSYLPLKPAGVDEYLPHLQTFAEVVPFLDDGNGNYISISVRAISYAVSKPTLAEYVTMFKELLKASPPPTPAAPAPVTTGAAPTPSGPAGAPTPPPAAPTSDSSKPAASGREYEKVEPAAAGVPGGQPADEDDLPF